VILVMGIIFTSNLFLSSGYAANAFTKLFPQSPSTGVPNATYTPTTNQTLSNPAIGPNGTKSNATATISINVDACDPKSQNPLNPKSVTIQVGGMVNWTNNDKLTHEFISGVPNALTNLFDSGLVDPGKTTGVMFKNPGTFSYFDRVCNNVVGTINVVPSSQIQQQAITTKPLNSTLPRSLPPQQPNATLPRQLIVPPSSLPNSTASSQVNTTLPKPLAQSQSRQPNMTLLANITGQPSQKPAATTPAPPPQQQQSYTLGFNSRGTINSIIHTSTASWIASGTWIMNVDKGNVTFFDTNMTWYNSNGITSHTHEFQDFKSAGAKMISLPQGGNNVSFKGIMDVGTNHRIVWKNVPTTININGSKTISISVADNATNHHFAGQRIFGLVTSFIPCSNVPGANMEVLPTCNNEHRANK
jgi:plastocyanin